MKIKDTVKSYEEVCKLNTEKHKKPIRQSTVLRHVIKILSKQR